MTLLGLLLIRLYRNFLSPYMLHGCRFVPSCSGYAQDAIHALGLWRALPKILRRLARCRPFGPCGYDPAVK